MLRIYLFLKTTPLESTKVSFFALTEPHLTELRI